MPALGIVLVSLFRAMQPVGECRPINALYGSCDPVDLAWFVPSLIGLSAVVFFVVFVAVLVVRAVATSPDPGEAPWRRTARAIALVVVIFAAGIGTDRLVLEPTPAAPDEFGLIRESWDLIHTEYVRSGELDAQAMAHAAIAAMADAVGDTDHTYFFTPDAAAATIDDLLGDESAEEAVSWAMIPGTSLAHVRIDIFADGVSEVVAATIAEAATAGASGIILDLRGSPGGLGDEAVWVASLFLESGAVLQGRNAWGDIRTAAVEGPIVDTTTPLVVLVDADTWSSAEIVASALQDAGRATLVGQTTAGTGTILDSYPLWDGSELSVGTMEWLTRDGRSVWRVGVRPDVRVALPRGSAPLTPTDVRALDAAGLLASGDTQLLRAISLLAGDVAVR